MIPRATYRLQFHRGFRFGDAERIVPYLHDLGISHIYASPITTARSGSTHGYDVVDPTRVNPELGGEPALRSLVSALHAKGMGLIIDIVPNHMGVAGGENAWWNEVLRHGQSSEFAHYFDIDWSRPLMLPILGAPLEQALADGAIAIAGRDLLVHGEHRVPLRPEDWDRLPEPGDRQGLAELLERQHYRLAWWRLADDELNWRRFFTISDLAGLRVEEPDVFEATHALYFRLYAEGLIDGVRIDHVDGLTDPGTYCRTLRARFDAIPKAEPAWIVVEKILGSAERLARNWEIDGTSGYDFMEQVSALLHDPAGEARLTTLWAEISDRPADFAEEELRARDELLAWSFEGQLQACTRAFLRLARSRPERVGWSEAMLRRGLERLLRVFPAYRTYDRRDGAPDQDAILEHTSLAANGFGPLGEREVHERILAWLAEGETADELLREARRRFNQLAAPIAAKAVEDTAFYRYGRLLSRNDVGFDPARLAMPVEEFHAHCEGRSREQRHALLATATHDHKRGEDVRARLAVLSAVAPLWKEEVGRWDALAGGPESGVHPADRYMLYQTIYGAWPDGLRHDEAERLANYARRLEAWQEKALREAKLRSFWELPNQRYEERCAEFAGSLLEMEHALAFREAVVDFVTRTQAATLCNSLVQLALRCLTPGVPDTYQGTELEDLSLVDPDNRRAVDFALREDMLAHGSGGPKLRLLYQLLTLRRDRPAIFTNGEYRPLAVSGVRAEHVLAFERGGGGESCLCVVAIRCASALLDTSSPAPDATWWGETSVEADDGRVWKVADILADCPVHVSCT